MAQSEEEDIGDDITKLEERLHEQVFPVLVVLLALILILFIFCFFFSFGVHSGLIFLCCFVIISSKFLHCCSYMVHIIMHLMHYALT